MGYLLVIFSTTILISFVVSYIVYLNRMRKTISERNKSILNISKKTIKYFGSYFLLGEKISDNDFDNYFVEPKLSTQKEGKQISVDEIIRDNKNVIIVGKAGVGKSTFLQKLLLEYNKKSTHVSLLIKLRDFFAGLHNYDHDQLIKYIHNKLFIANDLFGYNIESGIPDSHLIILLDGLDEVGLQETIGLVHMIDLIQSLNNEIKFVITSRPVEYLNRLDNFSEILHLNNFTLLQAKKYLEKFNIKDHNTLREIESNELFLNPLLLSLLIIRYRNKNKQDFPSSKYSLLKQIIYEELPNWSKRKRNDSGYFLFTQELKRKFYINCAKLVFETRKSINSNQVSEIVTPLFIKSKIPLDKIDAFISDLTLRDRILLEENGFFKFYHENILEFFIADSIEKKDIVNSVLYNVNNPAWKEIITLLFFRVDDPTLLFIEVINNVKINGNIKKVLWEPIYEGVKMQFNQIEFWDKLNLVIFEDDFQRHRVTVLRDIILDKVTEKDLSFIIPYVWGYVKTKSKDIIESFKEAIINFDFDTDKLEGFIVFHKDVIEPRNNNITIIGEDQGPTIALEKTLKENPFSFENDKMSVAVQMYDYSTAISKVKSSFESKTNEFDIIIQPHRELGNLVKNGLVLPVFQKNDDFDEDSLNNEMFSYWHEFSWFGEVCYGVPFALTTMYICYRLDAFIDGDFKKSFVEKFNYFPLNNKPSNWGEIDYFLDYYSKQENYSRISASKTFNSIALQGKGYDDVDKSYHPSIYYEWLNFVYSFGGDILKQYHGYEYGPIVINSPETIQATEKYISFYFKKGSDSDSVFYTWDEVYKKLMKDQLLLGFVWNDATFNLCNDKKSIFNKNKGKIGFCNIPEESLNAKSQVDGWSMFIPVNAKNTIKSKAFIKWFLNRNIQKDFQLKGGASAFSVVYDDSQVQQQPYNSESKNSLLNPAIRETIPEMSLVVNEIIKTLNSILKDNIPIELALNKLALELHQNILFDNEFKTFIKYMNNGLVQKTNEYFRTDYKEVY